MIRSFFLFFFILLVALPLCAQKKRTAPAATHTLSAEQLVQQYRFSEAAQLLQKEANAARAAGRSTERIEAELSRANLGADMLRGTERVTFVDSFRVERAQMLSALRLSPESGRLVALDGETSKFAAAPQNAGGGAYVNELADRIVFAAADSANGPTHLQCAYRTANGWGKPLPLMGLQDGDESQDYPFVMPDGVTLYYGAQGGDGLGGYDIYITRYNSETKEFVQAENLGMPFNSPANDYLMAIDEANNLGWLVTDRRQAADSVCVYVFIPNATRDTYEMSDANKTQVVRAAQLMCIAETQTDASAVKAAKERLAAVIAGTTVAKAGKQSRYVINDHTVYTQLSDFKSAKARTFAQQADELAEQIATLSAEQDSLQRLCAKGQRTEATLKRLRSLNAELPALRSQLCELQKNMRQAETE